ncbi:MAG: DUF4329 domain-containing protein, partial [Pseudomonadota bacterium]
MPHSVVPAVLAAVLSFGVFSPVASEPYSHAERALAEALLSRMQLRSFADGVEFCGYIYSDAVGRLRAGSAARGDADSCSAPFPAHQPVSSWHTHGEWDPESWNEVPSALDIETDALEGVNGWVATPGGRLWFVDGREMTATLVCGPACLPQDPRFIPGGDGT